MDELWRISRGYHDLNLVIIAIVTIVLNIIFIQLQIIPILVSGIQLLTGKCFLFYIPIKKHFYLEGPLVSLRTTSTLLMAIIWSTGIWSF